MKSSDALREARKVLEQRHSIKHVCVALEIVGADRCTDVGRRLKSIFAHPYGARSIVVWLRNQGLVTSSATAEDFFNYRLRWIDWMIEGYEKVGD